MLFTKSSRRVDCSHSCKFQPGFQVKVILTSEGYFERGGDLERDLQLMLEETDCSQEGSTGDNVMNIDPSHWV